MTKLTSDSDPSRAQDDGQDWFWSRPQEAAEQTQVIPAVEQTQVIPAVDQTQVIPAVDQTQVIPAVEQTQVLGATLGTSQAAPTFVSSDHYASSDPYAGPQPTAPGQAPSNGWEAPQQWAPPTMPPVGVATSAPRTSPRRRGLGLIALVGLGTSAVLAGLLGPTLVNPVGNTTVPSASAPAAPQQGTSNGEAPAEQQPFDPWGVNQGGATNEQSGSSVEAQTAATGDQKRGVVLITTRTASGQSAGTGMVLSADGYVLTNYHVVQSSTQLQVEVASTRKTYTATVIGHDASRDVALLKLSDASGLDVVKIDGDGLSAGQTVTAIGNSEGQGYLSAASGKVTDLDVSITVSNESSASGKEYLADVIKTTAGAVPGDSGGPLVDDQGEVVGMTTAGEQSRSGPTTSSTTVSSYAVPIGRALDIVQQIQKGDESGTVKVGPNAYLGVSVRTQADGSILIASVVQGGPADDAGLSRGDTITSIGDADVTSHAALSAALAEREPGDKVTVGWTDAQGQTHTEQVTLGSSPVN